MLTDFFYHLRAHKLPVSVQEYLTLLERAASQTHAAHASMTSIIWRA